MHEIVSEMTRMVTDEHHLYLYTRTHRDTDTDKFTNIQMCDCQITYKGQAELYWKILFPTVEWVDDSGTDRNVY
jgi:hypothetical protein